MKKYVVDLDEAERELLEGMAKRGEAGARRLRRAHILLRASEGMVDREIARALGSSVSTVERVRQRFVEEGLEEALSERARVGGAARRRLDGKGEAYLVALACSDAPEGAARWSMRMLADRLVEVGVVGEISGETVRRTLKRGPSNHG